MRTGGWGWLGQGAQRTISQLVSFGTPLSFFKTRLYIGVEKSKVLCQLRQKGCLLLIIGLDHKGRISGSRLIFLRLALDETTHVGDIISGDVPLAEDLIRDSGEVVIGINERDFSLEWTSADVQGFSPHGPIGVGVFVAVVNLAQVVDVGVEVPVAGNVVEGVIL